MFVITSKYFSESLMKRWTVFLKHISNAFMLWYIDKILNTLENAFWTILGWFWNVFYTVNITHCIFTIDYRINFTEDRINSFPVTRKNWWIHFGNPLAGFFYNPHHGIFICGENFIWWKLCAIRARDVYWLGYIFKTKRRQK